MNLLKNLSYRQKIKMLPVAFGFALLLIYLLAIRETIKVKSECNELMEQMTTAGNAPQEMADLHNKLDELNKIMGKDTLATGTDPLLEFVSNSAADMPVKLVDYQPLHVYQHQNYEVETRIAVFEGSYTKMLKFLYHLEKEFKAGKVVSVKFQTEVNFKTDRKRLLMTLYVQSVKDQTVNTAEAVKS